MFAMPHAQTRRSPVFRRFYGATKLDSTPLPTESDENQHPEGLSVPDPTELAATIQGLADSAATKNAEIEQGRVFASQARAEIESLLTAIREALDSAKALQGEIATQHAAVQTSSALIAELKASAAASTETTQATAHTATENGARLESLRTVAEQSQGAIVTKSEQIESARIHAEKTRSELDRVFTESQQSATQSEAAHQASRATSEAINQLHTAASVSKANAESASEAVTKLRLQCEADSAVTKKLAELAQLTEQKVAAYETHLAELEKVAADRLKVIEALLPGATSAGLASAFNDRRAYFTQPQIIWQCFFVTSILSLLGLAFWELSHFPESNNPASDLSWDRLLVSLLRRLPIALPLIWLAIHSAHKAALAQRVEEDYAFKETVSRAFEGYRREMAELGEKAVPNSVLLRLCEGVLSVITDPPGRIYEKHKLNTTPLEQFADSVGPIGDGVAKLTSPQVKVTT